MLFGRSQRSADHLYLEARTLLSKVVSLGIYDSEDMLGSVAKLLQKARQQNPRHVPSLVLLSDVFMAMGADKKALDIVESLIALEPHNQTHVRKKILLMQLQAQHNDENREAVRAFVEARWTQTSDW